MTTACRQASNDIIEFLQSLRGTELDLPASLVGYWQETIAVCKDTSTDWVQAKGFCNRMISVLEVLDSDRHLVQKDTAVGLVSILSGAVYLGDSDLDRAYSFFLQGANYLNYRNYNDFQSLAYLGTALTHKEQEDWSGASAALQKSLDAIHTLTRNDTSDSIESLRERIHQEIISVAEASKGQSKEVPSSAESMPFQPPRTEPTWIPILRNIVDGRGKIEKDNIIEYLVLDENYRNNADFGISMRNDSMKGHGILSGDIVLIRQQGVVDIGEIAAVVIETPSGLKGVIRQYYRAYEKPADRLHWFLKSNNPGSKHLVVIPSGMNVRAIITLYEKEKQARGIRNPIDYYKDSTLTIAGKYVGLVRKA